MELICVFLLAIGIVNAKLPWGTGGDPRFPVIELPDQNWNHYNGNDNFGLEAPASTRFGKELIITGGRSLNILRKAVWAYDIGADNWTYTPEELDDMYTGRAYHTANVYRDYLFNYGGNDKGIEIQQLHGGDEHVVYEGPGPHKRIGHTSVLYDEALYVFGGFAQGSAYGDGEFTSELWRASLKYGEIYWELIEIESAPGTRAGHSAIVYQDSMYIYGGETDNGVVRPDLWRYDFLTHSWVRVFDWTDCDAKAGKMMPPAREGHAAVYWADEGMYIWGGFNYEFGFLNDMWRFDLQKEEWTQIWQGSDLAGYKSDGFTIPSERGFFAYTVVDGKFVVTGGQVGMSGVSKVFWSPKTRFVPIESDDSFAGDVWEFDFCTRTWNFVACLPPWSDIEIDSPVECRSNFKPQCEDDCNGNGVCVRDGICICRGQWTGSNCSINVCAEYKYLGYDVDLMDRILVVESILNMGKNLRRLKEKLEFIQARLPPYEEFTTCIKFNPIILEYVRNNASTDGLLFNQDVESSLQPVVREFNQILENRDELIL